MLGEDKTLLSFKNIRERPKTISEHRDKICQEFNCDLSMYNLWFGLVPTLWDTYSDLRFGWSMETQGEWVYAGLCYFYTTFPFWYAVMLRNAVLFLLIPVGLVVLLLISLLFYQEYIFLFRYMAIIASCFLIAVKLPAVFIHTEWMRKLSMKLTVAESFTESLTQLLLVTNLWLSGGQLYLSTMVSSVLVIGKVSAEAYLVSDQQDLLRGKSFCQRVLAVIKLMPFFSLTAIFRIGSLAVISQSLVPMFEPYLPDLPVGVKANIIALFFCHAHMYLTIALTCMLSHCSLSTSLKQLSLVDILQGSMKEAATTAVWGKLGRERSKPIQLAYSTFYFIMIIFWIIFALTLEISFDPNLTLSSYSVSHTSIGLFLIVIGLVSYIVGLIQILGTVTVCSVTCRDSSGLPGLGVSQLSQQVCTHFISRFVVK